MAKVTENPNNVLIKSLFFSCSKCRSWQVLMLVQVFKMPSGTQAFSNLSTKPSLKSSFHSPIYCVHSCKMAVVSPGMLLTLMG